MPQATFKLGSTLSPETQKKCLRRYVHRFTKEHRPMWATIPREDDSPYMPQFASDKEWLENTEFAVNSRGELDGRVKHCISHPTWPDGK